MKTPSVLVICESGMFMASGLLAVDGDQPWGSLRESGELAGEVLARAASGPIWWATRSRSVSVLPPPVLKHELEADHSCPHLERRAVNMATRPPLGATSASAAWG